MRSKLLHPADQILANEDLEGDRHWQPLRVAQFQVLSRLHPLDLSLLVQLFLLSLLLVAEHLKSVGPVWTQQSAESTSISTKRRAA